MKTKETLKQELINLLNVPSYKKVRQIPFSERNYIQNDLQMEFDRSEERFSRNAETVQ